MSDYLPLPRRYRPKTFDEVVGQSAVVTTLRNALQAGRIASAYLFSGPKGTGKTTFARLLAKALNCANRTSASDPCNVCPSCQEIQHGCSLDVLEVDGASHRGVEDIRNLNETVGYVSAGGQYKVYIVDEVHMLTKEAFNALLKTLEEPPPKVVFVFATTEPLRVLPTILSRCQHFQLRLLSDRDIALKLKREAQELGIEIDDHALHLICRKAEGSMRDAESLLDQLICFHGEKITAQTALDALGQVAHDLFFRLDVACAKQEIAVAFRLAHEVLFSGRSALAFIEGLLEHYRNRLLLLLELPVDLPIELRQRYEQTVSLFSKEQSLLLIDELIESQEKFKGPLSEQLVLEALLLRLIRNYKKISISQLVDRLEAMERQLLQAPSEIPGSQPLQGKAPPPLPPIELSPQPPENPKKTQQEELKVVTTKTTPLGPVKAESEAPRMVATPQSIHDVAIQQSRYNTILRFAAVELDGSIEN